MATSDRAPLLSFSIRLDICIETRKECILYRNLYLLNVSPKVLFCFKGVLVWMQFGHIRQGPLVKF